tara:strand:- start:826 stop:1119 length:294 start_codon:yes stop_codon:yes gene_type:complete
MNININTNYIPNKKPYNLDIMHKNFFNSLKKVKQQIRENDFKNWLYSNLEDDLIVNDILNELSYDVVKTLKSDGYNVNVKPFRDEMASLIYYNSYTK